MSDTSTGGWIVARCAQCGWKKRVRHFAGYGMLCPECFFSRTWAQMWSQARKIAQGRHRAARQKEPIDEEDQRLRRQDREQRALFIFACTFLFVVMCALGYLIVGLILARNADVLPPPG